MTSTPSVEDETEQAHGPLLGKYEPSRAVHLTLHARGDYAVLLRHRHAVYTGSEADLVAHVDHADGVVSAIEWDRQHGQARPEWLGDAEAWVRERIAERS